MPAWCLPALTTRAMRQADGQARERADPRLTLARPARIDKYPFLISLFSTQISHQRPAGIDLAQTRGKLHWTARNTGRILWALILLHPYGICAHPLPGGRFLFRARASSRSPRPATLPLPLAPISLARPHCRCQASLRRGLPAGMQTTLITALNKFGVICTNSALMCQPGGLNRADRQRCTAIIFEQKLIYAIRTTGYTA